MVAPLSSSERNCSVLTSEASQIHDGTQLFRRVYGPSMSKGREPAGAAVLQESVTAAITSAMFDQLAEIGYARMSMDAVARRAGVGKAAVYRRWRSKQAMLI